MQKKDILNSTHFVLITTLAALIIALFFHLKDRDIRFSQQVFAGLVKGRTSAQKLIDWENLQALGIDVGREYSGLPADQRERTDYKNAFIRSCSRDFARVGGSYKAFVNWRIYDDQGACVVVAADYKSKANKTILFTLRKTGKKKLLAMQWKQ